MNAALDEGVKVIAHSFADPAPFVPQAHDAGATVICQVRSVDEARRAADAGVDVITAQGTEAGGHTGHISTATLVPAVVDAVAPVPVSRREASPTAAPWPPCSCSAATGAWIGTRFLATPESGVSEAHKRAANTAGTDDTILTEVFDIAAGTSWPSGVAGRRDPRRVRRPLARQRGQLRTLVQEVPRVRSLLGDEAHDRTACGRARACRRSRPARTQARSWHSSSTAASALLAHVPDLLLRYRYEDARPLPGVRAPAAAAAPVIRRHAVAVGVVGEPARRASPCRRRALRPAARRRCSARGRTANGSNW